MGELIEEAFKGLVASGPAVAVLVWVILDMRAQRDRLQTRLDKLTDALTGVKGDLDGDGKPG